MEHPKPVMLNVGGGINVQQLMRDPNFPKFYSNGFVMGRGENDIFLLPMTNGAPTHVLNLSFTAAKKLYEGLKKSIEEIEAQIGEIKAMPPVNVEQKNEQL